MKVRAMAQLQTTADPKTGKIIQHFGEDTQFTMYTKRYNGKRIVAYMATGTYVKDVLEFYNNYKIYKNDRKYLYQRRIDEAMDTEVKVLSEIGDGKNKMPCNVGRKPIPYKTGFLAAQKLPISLTTGMSDFVNKQYVINSYILTKSQLVGILLADFLNKTEIERVAFITRGDLLLERHKLACGGVSVDRIEKVNALLEESDESDLL